MLKTEILHPQLLEALALCGHKCRILLTDGNYAVAANSNSAAQKVYLNFCRDTLGTTVILQKLLGLINVERALMMQTPPDFEGTAEQEYYNLLGPGVPITKLDRQSFYEAGRSCDTTLVIVSGDTRRFANIILTVGTA